MKVFKEQSRMLGEERYLWYESLSHLRKAEDKTYYETYFFDPLCFGCSISIGDCIVSKYLRDSALNISNA